MLRQIPSTLLLLVVAASTAYAHEHADAAAIDPTVPIDTITWLHVALQAFVWLVIFPAGMVLGMAKSRWHVPLQCAGLALTTAGYVLGHSHGGRQFAWSVHVPMATVIIFLLAAQTALGIYLKLHINETTLRPWAVRVHGILGKCYPLVGWVQTVFGYAALGGYCRNDALGQCLAHYIMGSAFIAYGIIMIILLGVGASFIGKKRSQELFDSSVICVWGIVNTFTEHHGGPWTHKDLQHTMLGVLWWAGGALGIFLSRNNQRSLIPSILIIMTGWAFSGHAQALMLSTNVHAVFGITLMSAGVARIIEIVFVLKGKPSGTLREGNISAWQWLPAFGLVASGCLFMSATDEELRWADSLGVDHVTYSLILFSAAFIIFLHVCLLMHLYMYAGKNGDLVREGGVKLENGHVVNGHAYVPVDVGDAEVFELGGLDEEDAEELPRK
ncbi:putative membrane protein [Calocera viscosa TUFC12733]|uniref:Putative membrane protein n=1 Tax=Calocera viscosa (strain TUFC12733) TaxID=1330018 RepID=A0A167FWJ7_CALVF|nr:putative membrane protein [Calocera viscosa TUFC12733]